jgi:uncharacterized protein (DUF697 family)
MPGLQSIAAIWENISEVDLQALREQAIHPVRIALVGVQGSGRDLLASQLRRSLNQKTDVEALEERNLQPATVTQPAQARGLDHLRAESLAPLYLFEPVKAGPASQADLIILLVNSDLAEQDESLQVEQSLAEQWRNAGKRLLVLIDQPGDAPSPAPWLYGSRKRILQGKVDDPLFLRDQLIPSVLELLPDHLLSLARHFPLFRLAVAQHLINDTCLSNASYSFSTGLVGLVPVLDIPLTVTDMLILTKNQAFLVYKLGLALGYSTRWQDYVTEFGGVLGSGFLWRQLARSLVGLIPGWGILPKTAVAYAGTYVVGQAVLQWDLTGRHVSRDQMQRLYLQAAARAKKITKISFRRKPYQKLGQATSVTPTLGAAQETKQLEMPAQKNQKKDNAKGLRSRRSRQKCPDCGKQNSRQAIFCQYCGHPLSPPLQHHEQVKTPQSRNQGTG